MITTGQIAAWAATGNARAELPRLVRLLIQSTASTTRIVMPAGDSTSLPDFDGEVQSEAGNAWVPKGQSCWELSCESNPGHKAEADYTKRTAAMAEDELASRTYVALTARKWSNKKKWADNKGKEGKWADVRAYDADDLEQWLEQAPAIAVNFAENLGIAGPGVVSPSSYFSSWASQCQPAISAPALLAGRERQGDLLREKYAAVGSGSAAKPISIKADSVEEAVAFIVVSLEQHEDAARRAIVVTGEAGWRFVEANSEIRIAIAVRPEIATAPPNRNGLAIIVPYAAGDMSEQFDGLAGHLDDQETHLDRPDHSVFENALQEIGVEENDARRLSELCGRSWSVFRRQHAVNPAIRRPAWLDHPSARALSTVCLIGAWSAGKTADKDVVARVAGRSHDALEADLLELARLDDSPVLHIGSVWKAKSPLELLALFGDRIMQADLDRFFGEAKALLSQPDPQLDLPNSERWAAAIHGKARPTSDFLLDAICDTLIKLAVRGPTVAGLRAKHIDRRVDGVVRELLQNADAKRWLSLSTRLPALAEASPEVFLAAVETSLAKPEAPVRCLLTETEGAGVFGGRSWHAGLLWALEILGWSPRWLTRVSLTLARLTETTIAGNWLNTPSRSLLGFYRSWLPYTAATLHQRIVALDVLIAQEPKAAADLLDTLTNTGHDIAHDAARPKWRDDDAGVGYSATGSECHGMLVAAADRQLRLAKQDPKQTAALVKKYAEFDDDRRKVVLELLDGHAHRDDEDKETVRAALRSVIHWHRNYADNQNTLDILLSPLQAAYERLTPEDIIIRSRWLFENSWPKLPARHRDYDYDEHQSLVNHARAEALAELFRQKGWADVVRLAEAASAGWLVGRTILATGAQLDDVFEWVVTSSGDLARGALRTSLADGMLSAVVAQEGREVIDRILRQAGVYGHDLTWRVRFLTLAPEERATWVLADKLGTEAHDLYWQTCSGNIGVHDSLSDRQYALGQLIEAGRPAAALRTCHTRFDGIDPELVMQMLDCLLRSVEPGDSLPESYDIQMAIDYVEASGQVDRMRLAQLEFALIKALGFQGEQHAVSLYHVLMSQPELFVELLCLLYKPKDDETTEVTEAQQAAASNAWNILRACVRQPGTAEDGSVTEEALSAFVHRAREVAKGRGRLEACDSHLGGIMARGPEGRDGIFPFEAARNVLDAFGSEKMLDGFITGCFNKRGMRSRGVFDGGEQERELASGYRANARALEITHPRVSAALEGLARSYDRDGLMHDLEVRMRRERL